MSKLQNRNSYVIGTAYSLFGLIETLCLAYTLIIYSSYIVSEAGALNFV